MEVKLFYADFKGFQSFFFCFFLQVISVFSSFLRLSSPVFGSLLFSVNLHYYYIIV